MVSRIGTLTLTGTSGKDYEFLVYPVGTRFPATFSCVYYLSRRARNAEGVAMHQGIYLGSTDDFNSCLQDHPAGDSIKQAGCNAVAVFINPHPAQREAVIADLLPALKPSIQLNH